MIKFGYRWQAMFLLSVFGLSLARAQTPPSSAPAPDNTEDERVMLQVNDAELNCWQADALVEVRAGKNRFEAAKQWLEYYLMAQEAKRQGIEILPKDAFYMEFYKNSFLAAMLTRKMERDMPEITEEQIRKEYDDDIGFRQPYLADIQHIRIRDRQKAEEIAALARKPGADFSALVKEYSASTQIDKESGGMLSNKNITQISNFLGRYFTPEISDAIQNAKPGDIIGPLPCYINYEIIKVLDVQAQSPPPTYESMRENIRVALKRDAMEREKKQLLQKLNSAAKIQYLEPMKEAQKAFYSQQNIKFEEPEPEKGPQEPQTETPAPDTKK